jgi:hypothetical protein
MLHTTDAANDPSISKPPKSSLQIDAPVGGNPPLSGSQEKPAKSGKSCKRKEAGEREVKRQSKERKRASNVERAEQNAAFHALMGQLAKQAEQIAGLSHDLRVARKDAENAKEDVENFGQETVTLRQQVQEHCEREQAQKSNRAHLRRAPSGL